MFTRGFREITDLAGLGRNQLPSLLDAEGEDAFTRISLRTG